MHRKSLPLIIPPEAVDPANKIVLAAATYSKADRPKVVSLRFAGERPGVWSDRPTVDAPFPFPLPAWVGLKRRLLIAYGHTVAWYCLDLTLTRQDGGPGANDKGRDRYARFVSEAIKAGYEIKWQQPETFGFYANRASFERSLVSIPDSVRPRVYADD